VRVFFARNPYSAEIALHPNRSTSPPLSHVIDNATLSASAEATNRAPCVHYMLYPLL